MVKPAFEFGFGLSYSSFEYSHLKISDTRTREKFLTFTVTNTGKMISSEIAQIYLSVPETENYTGGYRSPK